MQQNKCKSKKIKHRENTGWRTKTSIQSPKLPENHRNVVNLRKSKIVHTL